MHSFVIVENLMVGVLDGHECRGAVQAFQGSEHLHAFAERHVRVGVTVEKEEGSVNLVSVIEGTALHIEVLLAPGIAVGHADFAVGVTPVTVAPVA